MNKVDKIIKSCSYRIDDVLPDGSAPHTHKNTSEIIQTFENEGNIMINGTLYKMKKNGLYFIHGSLSHFVAPESTTKYIHSIITFDTKELEKVCYSLNASSEYDGIFKNEGGKFCSLSEREVIKVDEIFLEIKEILNDGEEMKYARAVARLIDLIALAASRKSENSQIEKGNFAEILTYISDHALEKISIDEVCEKTHISKYYLCRLFKENTGMTIGEFLKERRLSASKQLLVSTSEPITSIAEKCGFSDSSYFSKTFSREYGFTPTSFRKRFK